MSKKVEKFLEFNGKRIVMLGNDGVWWIAIKPICQALGVDYERQRRNLAKSRNMAQLPSEQTVVAADGKLRSMLCLPEFFIYGWIFKIESEAEGLEQYQWECYQVLYQHFHGALTGRKELLSKKAKAQLEIQNCMNKLDADTALKLGRANRRINEVNLELRKLDLEVMEEEKTLFDTIMNE